VDDTFASIPGMEGLTSVLSHAQLVPGLLAQ
jgi:hypothetical protein